MNKQKSIDDEINNIMLEPGSIKYNAFGNYENEINLNISTDCSSYKTSAEK